MWFELINGLSTQQGSEKNQGIDSTSGVKEIISFSKEETEVFAHRLVVYLVYPMSCQGTSYFSYFEHYKRKNSFYY